MKTLRHYNIREALSHQHREETEFSSQVATVVKGTALSQSHCLGIPRTYVATPSLKIISANFMRAVYNSSTTGSESGIV